MFVVEELRCLIYHRGKLLLIRSKLFVVFLVVVILIVVFAIQHVFILPHARVVHLGHLLVGLLVLEEFLEILLLSQMCVESYELLPEFGDHLHLVKQDAIKIGDVYLDI